MQRGHVHAVVWPDSAHDESLAVDKVPGMLTFAPSTSATKTKDGAHSSILLPAVDEPTFYRYRDALVRRIGLEAQSRELHHACRLLVVQSRKS